MLKTIFISSYPQSGSSYLSSILSETLQCPIGGNRSQDDTITDYSFLSCIIRTGSYVLCNDEKSNFNKLTPRINNLNWQLLDNHHRVILIIRNPKDICLLGSDVYGISPDDFLSQMIRGSFALPRWDTFIQEYFSIAHNPLYSDLFHVVKYEDLISKPIENLTNTLKFIGKKEYLTYHKNIITASAKKIGRVHRYFPSHLNDIIIKEFGPTMEILGY